MSLEKINMEVSIERSKDHACTGFVLYCKDTERSIASFWSESDAEKVEIAINSYDADKALIAKQAEQIKILRKELELSSDRLDAIWSNLGSIGAKNQSKANKIALEATKEQA